MKQFFIDVYEGFKKACSGLLFFVKIFALALWVKVTNLFK